ncbi:MAG: hypothetical protein B7X90_07030 [Novosphingobium sp. 17-62-19]|uniref:hypothetical protein n=1 Tax=Novosphingobium sp. 17-62-19 TaxID=1970406 RepID=UPI000BCDD663|nr:hypothetical protein [Novosphingobium sp. 17-62-19]OYX95299.1 MAG: hypothetical protein B7Y74_04655 [Novosphingobium sp. 35-62-5]OZA20092.1 MAG: hypothetical protein B7X90_07030 [Novosphingobium sp. 17-62-19]OZA63943.1 MAG: hypothetical protein B7X78_05380 [Sphingomonadales bacterium 39-62-4]HQS96773.1 hypothetical protein [Novosphingobium sp.]
MYKSTELLGLAAAALYAITAIMAARAAKAAQPGPRVPPWHRTVWLAAILLFTACAFSRIFGLEEGLRLLLRGELRDENIYSTRREYQSVIASAIIIAAALAAFFGAAKVVSSGVLKSGGRSRVALAAGMACAVMALLIVVRVVSLHALDVLIYRGPRLNWIVDIGATAAVGALAWTYASRQRHSRSR